MFLMLFPLLILSSCENQPKVSKAGRTINIELKISTIPESNLKLYVAKGKAGSYKKISSTLYKPESIKYSRRKYIGKTPMEKTFTFSSEGSEEGFWEPTEYVLYFIQKDSSEDKVGITPWSYHYEDPNSGAEKVIYYDAEQFPLTYFQTHPDVRNLSLQKDLRLEALE